MLSNSKTTVVQVIEQSQDNKAKITADDFVSRFLLEAVTKNEIADAMAIDIEELESDLKYAITQISAALHAVENKIIHHSPEAIEEARLNFPKRS